MTDVEDFAWHVGRNLRSTVETVNDLIDGVIGDHGDQDHVEDKTTFAGVDGKAAHSHDGGPLDDDVPVDGEGDKDRAVMVDMADGTQTAWTIHKYQRNESALMVMGQVIMNSLVEKMGKDSRPFVIDLDDYVKDAGRVKAVMCYIDDGHFKRVKTTAVMYVVHHVNEKSAEKMHYTEPYVPYNPYIGGKAGKGNWPWPIDDFSKYKYAPKGFQELS